MLRKATLLVVVLVLVAVGLFAGIQRMSTVTVTVGGGAITLVQKATAVTGSGFLAVIGAYQWSLQLPAPSTAGTTLVAFVGNATSAAGATASGFPTGWSKQTSAVEPGGSDLEVWLYPNNPGGISVVTYTGGSGGAGGVIWLGFISEWANVLPTSPVDATGTATAVSGTTLSPAITTVTRSAGDVAISAWLQATAGIGTVTFTSPPGATRLADNGSTSIQAHLDLEYLTPAAGVLVGPTLASTGTTGTASGVVLVLRGNNPAVDVSAFIQNDSMVGKLNTFDFGLMLGGKLLLEDGSGYYLLEDGTGDYLLDTYVPQLGDPVTVTISP